MKDIDEEISKVISAKIYEPEGYKNAIETALYKENIKSPKTYFYKMIAIVCSCLILLSGVAYASYAIIKNVFNNRKGVETAINNNYIMDGLEEYQESNGILVKINNILMDDYNLDISFNVKFDKELEIDNNHEFQFEKIIIIDEENRVLFYDGGKKVLEDFTKENNLEISLFDLKKNYINTSTTFKIKKQQENQFNLIYNLIAQGKKYPKSKEIVIYAENIILDENSTINGKWQIKQKLEEKFYNRKEVVYNCKNNNYDEINNIKLTTYETGSDLYIEIKRDKEKDKNELKATLSQIETLSKNNEINSEENDIRQIAEGISNEIEYSYEVFKDMYIKNSNGIKFYITNDINENKTSLKSENEENITYFNTFDMTIYDCTNVVELHFIYNNKEYNIELTN